MKTSSDLRSLAREQLKGGWFAAVGACVLYNLIVCASGVFAGVGPFIRSGV
jgi:uncharacterized membrane protein